MKKLIFALAIMLMLNVTANNVPQLNSQGNEAVAKRYQLSVYRFNSRGEQLIESGNLNAAESYYKNLSGADGKVGLGNVYSAKYQLGAAEKQFRSVLRSNPKHPGAHNGLGMVYYRMTTASNQDIRTKIPEYYEKAISEFKSALAYAPNYPDAHNNLGKIYQEQGRLEDAQREFQTAVNLDPNNGSAIVNLGTVYFTKGEIDTAIDQYKDALRLNSKDSTAHYRLGEAYVAQGKYGDAIKSLQTSLYQYPNSAPVHDKLGEAYQLQGNEAAAINEYRKSINIKPEYTVAYLKLSDVFEQRGDDEFAISELRSAVNVNPDFTEGKLKIAEISTNIDKEEQAIKLYQEILNSDPNNVEALKGISKAYFFKAQKDSMGGFVASPGDFVNAEQALRKAVAAQPNDLELHLALLRISELAGKSDAAEQELNAIVSKPASTPADGVVRGEALFALRRYKEGNDEFLKSLNYSTDIKDVLLLGDIYTVNGNLDLAKAAYSKALSIDANNVKASKALDRVKKLDEESKVEYRSAMGFFGEGQKIAAIDGLRKALAINSIDPMSRFQLAEAYNKESFFQNALDEYKAYLQLANNSDPKTIKKVEKNVTKLTDKISKMKQKNEPIKDYDEYVRDNRKKY